MSAAEVLFGAHVQIVVLCAVEHSLYARYRRYSYRSGRESGAPVSVIRTVNVQQFVVYPAQVKSFPREFDGRVCL